MNQFAPALAATLIGGGILLAVGYWFIDHRLHRQEARDRLKEELRQKSDVRMAVLRLVRDELESISARIDPWADAVRNDIVPYPVFDTSGWEALVEARALAGLRAETGVPLIKAYERIRAANGRLELFTDLTLGPTAVDHLTAVAAARRSDGTLPRAVDEIAQKYEGFRVERRERLVVRLEELHRYVAVGREAAEAELESHGDAQPE